METDVLVLPTQAFKVIVGIVLLISAAQFLFPLGTHEDRIGDFGLETFPRFGVSVPVAAGVGGAIGSWFGCRRLAPQVMKRLLAVVLVIASLKPVFT
jgi:uncharacterized membrane protein YfcA